mmetsp:Transcript_120220/g.208723  ORF Transcript_120220/g.208723 Transcript_120220/m.208723 type:complete len:255 (-) Transcript_120220:51-815(-)
MWSFGFSIPCNVILCCLMTSSAQHTQFVFSVGNMESGKSGEFVVELHPEWAPAAAARFEKLVDQGFFDSSRFFKVVSGFIAQFGLAKDPVVTASWEKEALPEEERKVTNKRGRLAFALENGKERSPTQIVINGKDNEIQDRNGLVPFAEVTGGMRVVDRLYAWYGAGKRGPQESSIKEEGNVYLEKHFPKLSYITSVRRVVVPATPEPPQQPTKTASAFSAFGFDTAALAVIIVVGGGWMAWSMSILPAKNATS